MVSFNAGIGVPTGRVAGRDRDLHPARRFQVLRVHDPCSQARRIDRERRLYGREFQSERRKVDQDRPLDRLGKSRRGLWNAPNYLTVKSGDKFRYDCHFVNKDSTVVTFGETAATGEMCMTIGYYFPAGQPTTGTGVGISRSLRN